MSRPTLSGPGVDRTYESAAVALSAAITYAERLRRTPGTFYVRDPSGTVVGRVEHNEHGTRVYTGAALAAVMPPAFIPGAGLS